MFGLLWLMRQGTVLGVGKIPYRLVQFDSRTSTRPATRLLPSNIHTTTQITPTWTRRGQPTISAWISISHPQYAISIRGPEPAMPLTTAAIFWTQQAPIHPRSRLLPER